MAKKSNIFMLIQSVAYSNQNKLEFITRPTVGNKNAIFLDLK
jgi:hypothetical protein